MGDIKEMSQKEKKIQRKVMDEANPTKELSEQGISCQHEGRIEIPETCAGTKRAHILFRGITKTLRNQLLNRVTKMEGQGSILASDDVHNISDSPYYTKLSDMSTKMYHEEQRNIMMELPSLLQDSKVPDTEKRWYNRQLNARREPDDGQISKTGDNHLKDILSHRDGGIYQSSALHLDVNTAGNNVVVRSDLISAFWTVEDQCYPKSRKRFKDPQVLSINSFHSGQHYWVVETSKSGNWRIGLCYPSIARKGFRSYIGCSNKSWGLCKWNNQYSVMHNCKEIHISPQLSSQKLGILLDYKAGQLSFYELGKSMRLLHTFTATFTEPLHAVFRIWLDAMGSSWILIKD